MVHRRDDSRSSRLLEVAAAFGKLGLISFGGPVAHLSYFRAEFVQARQWLSDDDYADLVALCQFLPGPASSQVVFALGIKRAGFPGALLASILFLLPSAMIMIAFAYGVGAIADPHSLKWLHGLKIAAVAVVAQAVWGMGRSLCPDRLRLSLCLCAAAFLLILPGTWTQVGVIAAGLLIGGSAYRRALPQVPAPVLSEPLRWHPVATAALASFFVLLITLPLLSAAWDNGLLAVLDRFYRAGALVFGGGHVVLPLLRSEVVPPGWVSDAQFLAGYGAAQGVPGPLFSFAAYLGTAMTPGPFAWAGGLWALLAIFLPAWLLIGGALPFWDRLRAAPLPQAALRGANAAVVGILLAALYNPVMTQAIFSPRDFAVALLAFAALMVWNTPAWAVVILTAVAQQWVF